MKNCSFTWRILFSCLVLLSFTCEVFSDDDHEKKRLADKIESLPGVNFPISFDQYAGYFTFSNRHGFHWGNIAKRKIFYWFVESIHNPAEDPVVFWTNGVS